ncbi:MULTISPECIES: helix-turn-helix transcriptional regulator [Sporosarcina]|uniref:Putative transcriptional regulator n=1 Tax=Sporosarcina newyorkensis TaxID=759851 RepID=A0A1T4YU41_9BACL|nr:helix-turn-helix transcriptional regulator [Sporosarcina newyorkensis]SKB05260.1 putative transcriptional regulator [Sporosarcina newyorkensis]
MKLENLQIVRKKNGLSYQDMASKLGVSFQSYWMIENGKRGLSYETAIKIAEILGTTPDKIFLSEDLTVC